MRRSMLLALAVTTLSSLALAQSSSHLEVFAGYSYLHEDFTVVTFPTSGLNGWNASASFKSGRWLGFTADVSGFYPSSAGGSAKAHTFLFGPQVSYSLGRITPFARFLIGDSNVSYRYQLLTGNNSLTYGAGGGIDYGMSRHFALRGQVDWLHNGFNTLDNQLASRLRNNVARVSTGIVFRF